MNADRAARRHRDGLPLPRPAGGAVLRPPRLARDGVRRRLAWSACDEGGLARVDAATVRSSATSATSTPSTCARAARTAMSGATGACARARRARDSAPRPLASSRMSPSGRGRTLEAERCRSATGSAIPLAEITLRTSRSSGPGGQHANVTASRVEAIFDVLASRAAERGAARTRARARGTAARRRRPGRALAGAQPRARAASASPSAWRWRLPSPAPGAPRALPPPRARAV